MAQFAGVSYAEKQRIQASIMPRWITNAAGRRLGFLTMTGHPGTLLGELDRLMTVQSPSETDRVRLVELAHIFDFSAQDLAKRFEAVRSGHTTDPNKIDVF